MLYSKNMNICESFTHLANESMNESRIHNILMPLVIVVVVVFRSVCGSSSEMLAMEVQHLLGRVKQC